MSIIIGADIVPIDSNRELFELQQVKRLIGDDLIRVIDDADYRIFNLETPLADKASPIEKYGRHLIASTKSVNGLKAIGIDAVTLANNHIMDQGLDGFNSTIKALESSGISYVGAGKNLIEAIRPLYFTVNGKKYGVYACAEHEFSIAKEAKAGVNPFDPFESLDHVESLKERCDYVIVLYHGGKEQYRYPSPCLQKACRKLVEKGADLVICQHSHCIGCMEKYQEGTIIYGQGNFLFNQWDNNFWNTGLILKIYEDRTIDYIPIVRANNEGVRLAEPKVRDEILGEFERRSDEICEDGFINKKYEEFVSCNSYDYLLLFSGNGRSLPFRVLNKLSKGKYQKRIIDRYLRWARMPLRNYIECEAHREIILRALSDD